MNRSAEKVHKAIDTAISRIDEAVEKIIEARQLNARMQEGNAPGTDEWHQHAHIDDKLHDALVALGQ